MDDLVFYWVWFSMIPNFGSRQKIILLKKFGLPNKIFQLSAKEIANIKGIRKDILKVWDSSKNILLIQKYVNYIKSHNIFLINICDDEYPDSLKNIFDPPITLFAKGDISLLKNNAVAIIGCRDATSYGLDNAYNFAFNLAKNGVAIVSGMAKGVDAKAHMGALDAGGKTIAVLGSGVDVPYPLCNLELYKDILKNGLLISEYIVGTKPEAQNFPVRNRIVSGLSSSIIITEAKLKSGTLITTDLALEQGKNLFALPGPINSMQSEGTNELIKQGAYAITSYEDVLNCGMDY